jgi:hypothetical protein
MHFSISFVTKEFLLEINCLFMLYVFRDLVGNNITSVGEQGLEDLEEL